MGRSPDLEAFPHTVPNTEPPKPGDLVFGPEGMLVICFVGTQNCTGVLINPDFTGVVDVPLHDYNKSFTHRALVQESIREIEVGSRIQ